MKRDRKPVSDGGALNPTAQALFERLKAWRRETAAADNVPAYVILHDRVLREIALQRPASLEALGSISGIGENKLRRFGERLLTLVGDTDFPPGAAPP
jgi:ATP-dependent DNA helicase RecQ